LHRAGNRVLLRCVLPHAFGPNPDILEALQIALAKNCVLGADYGTMHLTLETGAARRALSIVAIFAAAILSYQAIRIWLADHQIHSSRLDIIERGAALEPGNADAWDILGRYQQLDFAAGDPAQALAAFQRAVEDNPLSAYYWMNLAGAYEATGDIAHAREAFERARAVYPLSAEVAWNYGNFLLRQEQFPEGYAEIQIAVRADPSLLPLAISRTWRSNHDVGTLLNDILPQNPEAYLQALDFFASIQQAEPGLAVWQRLASLGQPIALPRSFRFLDELIREDRSNDASRVWREGLTLAGLPREEPTNQSLIWDGTFAHDFPNGGLGWRWDNLLGVAIDFDAPPPSAGARSVRLDFGGGTNPELVQPAEYVPVEPDRSYHFHAYLRTEAITTESGMQFYISDPNHYGAVSLFTENLAGTHLWTRVDAELTTGPQTHFLKISLYRRASRLFDNKLSGTVWMADLSLVPSQGSPGRTSP